MDKYAVFIDGGYFKKVLQEHFSETVVDYLKLSEYFISQDKRLRTYYYDCPPYQHAHPNQTDIRLLANFNRFRDALVRFPQFQIRLGYLKPHEDDYDQKMVDILLAIDLVKLSLNHNIQRAILITNDGDYLPAIRIARDEGVVVEICRYPDRPHNALTDECDNVILINQALIETIKRQGPKKSKKTS